MAGKPTYEELEQRIKELEREAEKRRWTEAELRKNRDLLAALIKATPMALFSKDRKGRYWICNDAFADYLGVPAAEIVGKTVYECWPFEEARVYHKKDTEMMDKDDEVQIYDYRLPHAKKGPRDGIFTKACFHDANGVVAGLGGYLP